LILKDPNFMQPDKYKALAILVILDVMKRFSLDCEYKLVNLTIADWQSTLKKERESNVSFRIQIKLGQTTKSAMSTLRS